MPHRPPRLDKSDFNINTFSSKIKERNTLLSNNKFLITLFFPHTTKVGPDVRNFSEGKNVQFFCWNAVLPGLNFTTSEVRRHGTGPQVFYPNSVNYLELPLTFYVDAEGALLNFIQGWFNKVMFMGHNTGDQVTSGGARPFEMYYRDEYKCRGILTIFDDAGDEVTKYTFNDLIPSSIIDTPLDWASENTLMEMSITLRYTSYSIEEVHGKTDQNALSASQASFERSNDIGFSLLRPAGDNVRLPQNVADSIGVTHNGQAVSNKFKTVGD